jgi:hypothetical protein
MRCQQMFGGPSFFLQTKILPPLIACATLVLVRSKLQLNWDSALWGICRYTMFSNKGEVEVYPLKCHSYVSHLIPVVMLFGYQQECMIFNSRLCPQAMINWLCTF